MALSTALKNRLIVALRGIGEAEELVAFLAATPGTSKAGSALIADASGNILIAGQLYQSFVDSIVAQHTSPSQSTATAMTGMINRVITVTSANDAVKLPASVAGLEVQVINHGANPMQVYGAGTDTINDVATATGVSQMQGSSVVYSCVTAGTWYAEDLGVGYSGQYPTQSSADNITALAGGAQAGSTALAACLNRVVTVASANDSVQLPQSASGMQITVINAHATNAVRVYPINAGADVINALSSSTAFAVAATKTCTFYCATTGQWHTLLSA